MLNESLIGFHSVFLISAIRVIRGKILELFSGRGRTPTLCLRVSVVSHRFSACFCRILPQIDNDCGYRSRTSIILDWPEF